VIQKWRKDGKKVNESLSFSQPHANAIVVVLREIEEEDLKWQGKADKDEVNEITSKQNDGK
jgi:hypothetical protein